MCQALFQIPGKRQCIKQMQTHPQRACILVGETNNKPTNEVCCIIYQEVIRAEYKTVIQNREGRLAMRGRGL